MDGCVFSGEYLCDPREIKFKCQNILNSIMFTKNPKFAELLHNITNVIIL